MDDGIVRVEYVWSRNLVILEQKVLCALFMAKDFIGLVMEFLSQWDWCRSYFAFEGFDVEWEKFKVCNPKKGEVI